jgi:hypothetical protein
MLAPSIFVVRETVIILLHGLESVTSRFHLQHEEFALDFNTLLARYLFLPEFHAGAYRDISGKFNSSEV